MNTCPACAEEISPRVKVCPHCGIGLEEYAETAARPAAKSKMPLVMILLGEKRDSVF